MTDHLNNFLRNHVEDKDRAIRALFVSIGFHLSMYYEQIDDIMAGRTPRQPADIGIDQEPPTSGVDLSKDQDRADDTPIGGPAPQH